jgi:hypothetical protein
LLQSFHRQGRSTNKWYSSDTLITLTTVHGVKDRKPELQKC